MNLNEATVLVVDDEPALRDIVGNWFRRVASRVVCAAHGAEALALLRTHQFDLMITDIRMPVMDGVTLLRQAKADGLKTPAVIFISGYSDIAPREAYDLGVEAMLEKPFERDLLIDVAQRSLMDRAELWKTPRATARHPVLKRVFASVEAAISEGRIAFGRGGICVEAGPLASEGPVDIELAFTEDNYTLAGQGIVRWLALKDNLMGIELISVDADSRARVTELAASAGSFIPRAPVPRAAA